MYIRLHHNISIAIRVSVCQFFFRSIANVVRGRDKDDATIAVITVLYYEYFSKEKKNSRLECVILWVTIQRKSD